jgi:hypothetical protein
MGCPCRKHAVSAECLPTTKQIQCPLLDFPTICPVSVYEPGDSRSMSGAWPYAIQTACSFGAKWASRPLGTFLHPLPPAALCAPCRMLGDHARSPQRLIRRIITHPRLAGHCASHSLQPQPTLNPNTHAHMQTKHPPCFVPFSQRHGRDGHGHGHLATREIAQAGTSATQGNFLAESSEPFQIAAQRAT